MHKAKGVLNPDFIKIFSVNLLNAIGFHVLTPILPKYVVSLGYSGAAAGMIGTAFTLTAIMIRCFAGVFSNEKRQKSMLIAALLIIAVAASGYAFTGSLPLLAAFRLLHGIGWGVATTLTAAAAVRSLPPDKVGSGLGLFGLASVAGQALAPNLGLNLVSLIGYSRTFIIAMILPAVAAALCFTLRLGVAQESKSAKGTKPQKRFHWGVVLPSTLILLVTFGVSCVSYFLALCAESRGMQGAGNFFTIYAFSLFFVRPTFGRLADRCNRQKILIPCAVGLIVSLVLIALTDKIWLWYAVAIVYGIGYGGIQPTLQTWCVQSVPSKHCAFANSVFYSCFDLGMFLGSTVGGIVADHGGYAAMYLFMCIPLALVIIISILSLCSGGKSKKEEAIC